MKTLPPVRFRTGPGVHPDDFSAYDDEMAVRTQRIEWLEAKYPVRLQRKLLEVAGAVDPLVLFTMSQPAFYAVVDAVVGRGR